MWERTLQDLIRGLRANKKDEAKFIAQAVDEIRREIRGKDMGLKAAAVLKLTYLDMLGYDMTWASFHVVEVMSSPKIHLKTVGYLGAAQSFNEDTDVLMLTTNLLKKDFSSRVEDVAITLNGFSQIVTSDLARDLGPDVIKMLTHSRAQIRKRAVLALFKVLTKYPDLTPQATIRLRERLEDSDPGVVAATINVICELSRRNPQDYLSLAPQLFHLLTTSSNNWMLIKVIKLFGTLTPHEPRLVKKLLPPITDIISTTPAISLLYECVHTCIIGGMLQGLAGNALARTCVTKLANFLQDDDQNLKYIALMAMVKIVPTHPHLIAEYQGMIMGSINDQDISIRMRALDLVSAMVNQDNLQSIVQQLLSHLVRNDNALPSAAQSLAQHTASASASVLRVGSPSQNPAYRLTLAQRILTLCSQDTYENVTDFEWYLSVLVDLAYVANVDVGASIRDQIMDVTARVRGARRYSVQLMIKLLCDDTFLANASEEGSCAEALWAAAWICGEYCGELSDPHKLFEYLLQPAVLRLAPDTIAVYLQSALKVFGSWCAELADRWDNEDLSRIRGVVDTLIERVGAFASSPDIEVQERAANILQLLAFVRADVAVFQPRPELHDADYDEAGSSAFGADVPAEPRFPKSLFLVRPLFGGFELGPVAVRAQASVPVPDGLDLTAWIVPPPAEELAEEADDPDAAAVHKVKKSKKGKAKESSGAKPKRKKRRDGEGLLQEDVLTPTNIETEEEKAERERRKAERMERLRDDPFYLADDRPSTKLKVDDVDSIPVVRLDDLPPLPQSSANSRLPSLRSTPRATTPQAYVIDRVGAMPEAAKSARSSQTLPSNGRVEVPDWGASSTSTVAAAATAPESPAPITVTRVKKKTKRTGEGSKKKRTTTEGGAAL